MLMKRCLCNEIAVLVCASLEVKLSSTPLKSYPHLIPIVK